MGIIMSKEWYYNQDDAPCGPVDEPEIIRLIQSGELPPSVLVCFEGGSEWLPAHQYTCFKVEVHPKKKVPEQAASVTVPKPASAGTPQSPGKASIQPKTSGLAIASLVCGIVGMCLWVPGMIGIVLGIKAIRQINGSAGTVSCADGVPLVWCAGGCADSTGLKCPTPVTNTPLISSKGCWEM